MIIDFGPRCKHLKIWWETRPRRDDKIWYKVFSLYPIRIGPCKYSWGICARKKIIDFYRDYEYDSFDNVKEFIEGQKADYPLNAETKWLWGHDIFISLMIFPILIGIILSFIG